MTVETLPLTAVSLDPANVRQHDDRNLDAIRGSLARFGQQKPIVIDSAGVIRAGNGTYLAAKALGWETISVVRTDLEGIEATAFAIADNRTSDLSTFDDQALAQLLKTLAAEDALVGTGFDDEDIRELLRGLDEIQSDECEDQGPEAPSADATTLPGDLWLLGKHRLLCGDSTKPEDLARLMAGEKALLLSTDPPYCVDYTGNDRPIHDGRPSGKDWSALYREVDIKDLGEFMDGVFAACLPHVALDSAIYVWHAHVQQPVIAATFEKHELLLHQVLVWVKPVATFGHAFYRWRHEPCAFGWRRGHKPKHGAHQLETVWELDWEGKARVVGNEHPTQKPTRIFEIPMEQHTIADDIVLEPFSGSGSQLVAAEKLGRRCRAMEISPAFVDAGIRRWQKATGKEARLEATGQTYAEVKAERAQ